MCFNRYIDTICYSFVPDTRFRNISQSISLPKFGVQSIAMRFLVSDYWVFNGLLAFVLSDAEKYLPQGKDFTTNPYQTMLWA